MRRTSKYLQNHSARARSSRRLRGQRATRRGVVLIVVLVLVVMLSLAGFAFRKRMMTEYEATVIQGDLRQAQQTMASAETWLVATAERAAHQPDGRHPFTSRPRLFSAKTVQAAPASSDEQGASRTVPKDRRWQFSVVQQLPTGGAVDQGDDEFALVGSRPSLVFGLSSESSRLHLGTVLDWDEEEPGAGREALMQIPGMTTTAADCILDWIDDDNVPREQGAENEYYSQLDPPYTPRNELPATLEELLYVKGVARDVFLGATASATASAGSTAWPDLLTVCSAEPNRTRRGQRRVQLNFLDPASSADRTGHSGTLSELPLELARYILLARMHGVIFDANGGVAPSSISIPHDPEESLEDIYSLGDLVDSAVQIPVDAGGQLVRSPLQSGNPDFADILSVLEDLTTVDYGDVLRGRININSAAEPVLKALLRDAGQASQLIQQRSVLDRNDRKSSAWLLTRKVLDPETYRRIYPYITTRGAVHSGEIVVYRRIGGPFLRRKIIIDASTHPARRLTWTDLTSRGLPVELSDLRFRGTELQDDLF